MISSEEMAMAVGRAALVHYRFSSLDPEFSKLVNSPQGENEGPISAYILQLNKTQNQFNSAGQQQNAAGAQVWNITFRCMSNNSFRIYGLELWNKLASVFDEAKEYLEVELENAKSIGADEMVGYVNGAIALCDYIPPQFRKP